MSGNVQAEEQKDLELIYGPTLASRFLTLLRRPRRGAKAKTFLKETGQRERGHACGQSDRRTDGRTAERPPVPELRGRATWGSPADTCILALVFIFLRLQPRSSRVRGPLHVMVPLMRISLVTCVVSGVSPCLLTFPTPLTDCPRSRPAACPPPGRGIAQPSPVWKIQAPGTEKGAVSS